MSSNNPFAFALNDSNSYVHHRDPPPPPAHQKPNNIPLSQLGNDSQNNNHNVSNSNSNSGLKKSRSTYSKSIPPPRPPKVDMPPPPSYEEITGDNNRLEFPKDKPQQSSRSNSNIHKHSQKDSNQERVHKDRSDRSDRTREHRHRERRSHSDSAHYKERSSKSSKNKKSLKNDIKPVKAKNLDTIDKMDVTAFFGGGFHHDGPFDACTPHRNKNAKQPPVLAFPVDGPNNSISGLQSIDKNQQINLAFGNYEDDDQNEIVGRKSSIKDKSVVKTGHEANEFDAPQQNPGVFAFDANSKSTPVHGSTTAGLGSTTFIDGAPAPIRVNNVENDTPTIGRKKSLVQRLRKTSSSEENTHRNSNESQTSGENGRRGSLKDDEPLGNSFIRRVKSLKVRR